MILDMSTYFTLGSAEFDGAVAANHLMIPYAVGIAPGSVPFVKLTGGAALGRCYRRAVYNQHGDGSHAKAATL